MSEVDLSYVSQDGDMIDWIVWRHYERTEGVVERLLEFNPGLAEQGPVLPAGIRIDLPDIPPPESPLEAAIWQ